MNVSKGILSLALVSALCSSAFAQSRETTPVSSAETYPINLETALKLVSAQNIDVQIARERVKEAKANHATAVSQFFPWISPGFTFRGHDNFIQNVEGRIIEVHKQSYAPGVTLGAQVDIGDAYYKSLVAKQVVKSSEHAAEAQRQASSLSAAQAYFDLLYAQSAVAVARDAIRISSNQTAQAEQAVAAGLIFKGDELRARVQTERNQLALRQALEQQRLAAAKLAQTLRLEPSVLLVAEDTELAPLQIVATNATMTSLLVEALGARPELKQVRADLAGARDAKNGTTYGPLIPTAGAQVFLGGLGGSSTAGLTRFGEQEDYFFGLSWKIGPGGLLDPSRRRIAESRLKVAELSTAKVHDEISREVVDAFVRVQSQRDQIDFAKQALTVAEQGLQLAQLRREFAVGVVLENIQAEQDLTRARSDYLKAVAEYNKAQYALSRALGKL